MEYIRLNVPHSERIGILEKRYQRLSCYQTEKEFRQLALSNSIDPTFEAEAVEYCLLQAPYLRHKAKS